MATWKKIIVSGSNAHLAQITSSVLTDTNLVMAGAGGALKDSNLTLVGGTLNIGANSIQSTGANTILTGSFTGSFTGTANLPVLSGGVGMVPFLYNGSLPANVSVSGATELTTNRITKWTGTSFANSSISDNGLVISGDSSIQLLGSSSVLTGSFKGSFIGDGSGLIGLPTTLNISGSTGNGSINLLNQSLSILGTTNEIETSVLGQTVTVGLPNNVTITSDLNVGGNAVITGNLTVNGNTTTLNTSNILVEDKFALFASGSTGGTDGGIVIQSAANGSGYAFGYKTLIDRWVLEDNLSGTATAFSSTPTAYVASAQYGIASAKPTDSTGPSYGGATAGYGNIWVSTDTQDIWIYA